MITHMKTNLRWIVCLNLLLSAGVSGLSAQIKHGLRDDQGRHVVARGFVVTTNDGGGEVFFDADDYARMVRMGANYQVIRLELGRLSTFPGCAVEEAYLQKLDGLVALGREAGMKTVMKMTVYGARSFKWEDFWRNEHGEFATYLEAWRHIWARYADEPTVVGYDLINEPRRLTFDLSYDDLTEQVLLPYYRRLIDAQRSYETRTAAICQAIFMNKGEALENNQYAEVKVALGRDHVYFSPHVYQADAKQVAPVMARLDREADLWDAPMFIGEWGFPTFATTDGDLADQQHYTRLYIDTVEEFDRLGVGTIKAWFSGNRVMQNFLPRGPSTWAIFSDARDAGTVERKYITDVIARPYPSVVAGDIMDFRFDFATRTLAMRLRADNARGASRIFVGADRHYPDGFSIQIGDDWVLWSDPLKDGALRVLRAGPSGEAGDFVWDPSTQHLTVLRWPQDGAEFVCRITPGEFWPASTSSN